jgi:hypothetical protein
MEKGEDSPLEKQRKPTCFLEVAQPPFSCSDDLVLTSDEVIITQAEES